MTKAEWSAARAAALKKIDDAIEDGLQTMKEVQRTLEDLELERKTVVGAFECMKPYAIGE